MFKINKNVVADSSFYICYCNDINKNVFLNKLLDIYSFHVGSCILRELPPELTECNIFQSSVNFTEFSFFEIVKPFFGRSDRHKDDGEYEAIGLAYYLNTSSELKNLIIDEKRAYKFVKNNFPSLQPKLTRNIGFIVNCYKKDDVVTLRSIIDILETIKDCIEKSNAEGCIKRPCSIDIKVCKTILISLINELKDEYECT